MAALITRTRARWFAVAAAAVTLPRAAALTARASALTRRSMLLGAGTGALAAATSAAPALARPAPSDGAWAKHDGAFAGVEFDGFKKTPSGLEYKVFEEGYGVKPTAGQGIKAHYAGYLLDGAKFDSSYDRRSPLGFAVGTGRVIKGWDEALLDMRVGEKRVRRHARRPPTRRRGRSADSSARRAAPHPRPCCSSSPSRRFSRSRLRSRTVSAALGQSPRTRRSSSSSSSSRSPGEPAQRSATGSAAARAAARETAGGRTCERRHARGGQTDDRAPDCWGGTRESCGRRGCPSKLF